MQLGRVAVLTSGFLSGAMAGHAGGPRWVEMRSQHFTVYSDAGEKVAGRVARQFERFRAAVGELFPKARLDPGIPILIFAARNEGSLKELLPRYWENKEAKRPAGVFSRGTRRYYIVLRTDTADAWRRDDNPFDVLYHEYMHLVIDLNFDGVPAWLNEGLAEFMSETVVTDDAIDVGRPIWPHMHLLRDKGLLSTAALFRVDHSSPEYNERDRTGVFYAQSWALVHYLLTEPKVSSAGLIWRLLSLYQGPGPDPAATAQLLGDPAELDRGLKRYVRQVELLHGRLESAAAPVAQDLQVRELTASQLAAAKGLLHVQTGRPVEARALLEEAFRLDPQEASAREGLGLLALQENKTDDARRMLAEAVQLPTASALAHYAYALVLLRDAQTEERRALAQSSLERAVVLDPAFAEALVALAKVSTERGADVDRILALMRRAVEMEPGVFDYRLTTAQLLLRCGEIEQARGLAGRLLARGRSEEDRSAARSLLASLSSPAIGLARDTLALVRILEARCGLGDAQHCLDLADRLRQGAGMPADPIRAVPLYEKACANQLFEACARAAQAYELGEGVAQDAVQTALFYEKGCEGGDLFSCGRLGWLLAEGKLVAKDESRSLGLSGKACDGGDPRACNTVGVVRMRRKEYAEATAPFKRSCEADVSAACGNLALLYEQGLGVSRDVSHAVALHKKACDAGRAASCERLRLVRQP